MKIDLSKVSTTSLTEELSRRSDEIGKNVFEVELRAIKKRIKRMALEFAVEYTTSFAGEKCLMFVLGIITNGQLVNAAEFRAVEHRRALFSVDKNFLPAML